MIVLRMENVNKYVSVNCIDFTKPIDDVENHSGCTFLRCCKKSRNIYRVIITLSKDQNLICCRLQIVLPEMLL